MISWNDGRKTTLRKIHISGFETESKIVIKKKPDMGKI
jgi:hypothetical protein